MHDLKSNIQKRIQRVGRGSVHVSKDFLDLGNRAAVDQALARLVKAGILRRLNRGLFFYPKIDSNLGIEFAPSPELVALAVARKRAARIVSSQAKAANVLGLSSQVPSRQVYLTGGVSETLAIGKQILHFKKVSPKTLGPEDNFTNTVLSALHYLGKDGLNNEAIARLQSTLSPAQKRKLLKDSRYSVSWISDAVKKIVLKQERK